MDEKSEAFYQALYQEEIAPCLKEEGPSHGLTSDQLEEVTRRLQTDLQKTEEPTKNTSGKSKQITYQENKSMNGTINFIKNEKAFPKQIPMPPLCA